MICFQWLSRYISSLRHFNDKIMGNVVRIKGGQCKPSSYITPLLGNIIRTIFKERSSVTLQRMRLRFSLQMMWGCWLPSEWQDFNVPPSPFVAGANLPLLDVIKRSWSSEWWRGPFLGLSLPLSGCRKTHSGFNTVQMQPEWGNAWCRDSGGYTGKLSQWIKKLFYHHLDWHLKILL